MAWEIGEKIGGGIVREIDRTPWQKVFTKKIWGLPLDMDVRPICFLFCADHINGFGNAPRRTVKEGI